MPRAEFKSVRSRHHLVMKTTPTVMYLSDHVQMNEIHKHGKNILLKI